MSKLDAVIEIFERVFPQEEIEIEGPSCFINGIEYDDMSAELSIARALNTEEPFSNADALLQEFDALRKLYEHLLQQNYEVDENTPGEIPAFTAIKKVARTDLEQHLRGIIALDSFRD